VATAIPSDLRSGKARGRAILLVAAILAVVLVSSMSLVSRRTSPGVRVRELDVLSPYRNTRREVKYVGDAACTRCHAEIAATYRSHPMGRSLAPIGAAASSSDINGDGRPLFEAQGLEYSVEHRDGRVWHQETRRDSAGRVVARNEAEVRFVVGSGRQAFAYLIERDGFLFQSPITWYAQKRRWDLAPGYENSNLHFHRPAVPLCLYCHANRVEPVAGTVNRYRPPIFRGHAIGCERCHGPGELHVMLPPPVEGKDMTIVNPADLDPPLRDAVCEQCHLNGRQRVLRVDRGDEDYRPGLPFHQVWSVFEPPAGTAGNRVVGQVEQMHQSRCFRASQGRLWCVSCHDPHQQPAPAERVAYYRGRCLECHADRGCSLAVRFRREDDCAGCHMPRARSTDVIHTATTNHRVLRHGNEEERSPTVADRPANVPRSLVQFHHDLLSDRERAEAGRDLGVDVCRDGPDGAAMALPLLEAALARRPDDVAAWEAKGFALGLLARGGEGTAAFGTALALEPDRESALSGAAHLAAQGGRVEQAIAYWLRAIKISPWRPDYQAELARLYFKSRDWRAAAAACRETLRLDATNLAVRDLLVRCELHLGHVDAARRELQTLLGFDPPDRDELLRWLTRLSRPH
jgi:tetratricopeptide (TPR) repeat protein